MTPRFVYRGVYSPIPSASVGRISVFDKAIDCLAQSRNIHNGDQGNTQISLDYWTALRGREGQYHPIAHIAIEYKVKMHIAGIFPIYIVGIDRLINPVKTFAWFPHRVGRRTNSVEIKAAKRGNGDVRSGRLSIHACLLPQITLEGYR